VVVPHSMPKTKPKACNYGLLQARGDYAVIYDAEDIPDPLQLKQAYLAFRQSANNVVCIQSKLNFYNPTQNLLTRAFTAEYSLWFDLMLTGMQQINAPIPLGGTSNHFKTSVLRKLGGWDAFNVTEDADLGMRLVKSGFKTRILDSITLEEANSNLKNWFWQRSRWIKGYIQTYLVHTRDLKAFRSENKLNLNAVMFQLIIGGKVLSMLINPIMWLLTITYFVFRPIVGPTIESLFPMPVLYIGVVSLIFGNFLYMYYYMVGCARRQHYGLIKYALLIPFYWLAMSAAAYYALIEFIYKPHHWRKTKHGLHLELVQPALEFET
jgi:cellulose synthase/poly-beta-1,6-N-acetylglucosamine synthase-like glycosyltransferase